MMITNRSLLVTASIRWCSLPARRRSDFIIVYSDPLCSTPTIITSSQYKHRQPSETYSQCSTRQDVRFAGQKRNNIYNVHHGFIFQLDCAQRAQTRLQHLNRKWSAIRIQIFGLIWTSLFTTSCRKKNKNTNNKLKKQTQCTINKQRISI